MPLYEFEDIKTLERKTEWLSLSEHEEYLKNNPHLRQVFNSIGIVDAIRLNPYSSQPTQFKERMEQIKKMNPGNTMP